MKSFKFLIIISLFFVSCNNTLTEISSNSLQNIIGSTTNKIEVSGAEWDSFIGKSNSGNFIALRVSKDIEEDGVLIVFTLEDLEDGIKDGGKIMNPLDRNVIDKMSSTGILLLPEKISKLQQNITSEKFNTQFNTQGDFHNVDITMIDFTEYFTKYTNGLLPSFYVEVIGDDVFMFGGRGNIVKMNLENGITSSIPSNLDQIINNQEYSSTVKGSDYSSRMGLRDSFYDKNKEQILITAIKKDFDKNCFTLGVLSADFNQNNLDFSWVFNIDDCIENFNSHHAGGRIQSFEEGYLLTVGDFKLPEDFGEEITPQSHLGKILFLDQRWSATIYSSGHRNPQGLTIFKDQVLSTEHGPFGGDEVNNVYEGGNYGWPSSAYGFTYSLENIYELDHEESFVEPIYFFTPSIGISELLVYSGDEFPRWEEFVFVSSLKDMTIYTLKLNRSQDNVIHVGKFYVDQRVRDMAVSDDGRLILAGDLGSLIIVNRTEKDIP